MKYSYKTPFVMHLVACTCIFILFGFNVDAQVVKANKYGLAVIKDVTALNKTVAADSAKKMIDLKKLIPTISFDLKYAGSNNFLHRQIYPSISTTYLRQSAATALLIVQKELNKKRAGFKNI